MSTDVAWRVVHVLLGLFFAVVVIQSNPGPLGWIAVVVVAVGLLAAWGVGVVRGRREPRP
ncbi:MAG: hypothetical protein KY451_12165 [Actinobacteria bacterium]|nr:hypothetical protein [Actinomycetota bacterium]MBW3648504.1 hypothetical protein [Actinomycetota bacterium]